MAPASRVFGLLSLLTLGCEPMPRQPERTRPVPVVSARKYESPKPTKEPPFGPLRVPDAGFPCAVDDALAAKCRRCHTRPTRHGAPFPLLTWDETQRAFRERPIWQQIGTAVQSGFMPYRIPTDPPVQPLTPEEKSALLEWVAAGAPRGSCDSPASTPPRGVATPP